MQEIIYGNYNKDDLKQIYEKDEIKNIIFYITHLSSQIIKSLKITIENGKGSTDIVVSSDDIVEVVYYEDQLFYGIGRVRNIHSPETLCLDFSANYYNLVKSVPVSNIRYIRVIPKDEKILGGLHISLFELNELINGKDCDCVCPVLPGTDDKGNQTGDSDEKDNEHIDNEIPQDKGTQTDEPKPGTDTGTQNPPIEEETDPDPVDQSDKDNVEDEIIPEEDDTPKDSIDNPPVEGDTNLEEYDNVEKVDVAKEEE